MKLRTFLAMALIALCTVSCSDDDEMVELDNQTEVSTQVAGSYTGVFQQLFGGKPSGFFDGTIKIEAQKDGKVTVLFPKQDSDSKMSMRAFTLTDVEVKSISASEFTFEHEAFTVDAGGIDYASKGLKGTLKNGVLTFDYDIKPGEMPMSINMTFTNDKNGMFAAKVVGSYDGATLLSVMKSASGAYLGAIEINAQEDGKFTIVTPEVGEGMMGMPALTIKDVVIKSTGANEYSIEHEKFTLNDKFVFTNGLNGTLKDSKLSLEYSIKPGEMPFPIEFIFTMDKNVMELAPLSKEYDGTPSMTVGKDITTGEGKVTLTAQANGKMQLTFPAVGKAPMGLQKFNLKDVEIKSVGENEYTLTHAPFTVTVTKEDKTKIDYVNEKGLTGTLKDGQLTLDFDITPGEMPFPIACHFGKKEVTEGPAAKVAGEYKGKFAMSMNGEAQGDFDGNIKVVATEAGKATVTVGELNPFGSMKIPAINLEDVEVEAVSETEYTLKHDAFTITLAEGKDCVNQKGLKGSVKDGVLTMEFDIKYGVMPHVLDLKFISAK